MGFMARGFLPYTLDQRLLLPPDMRSWLPAGHAALFVSDVVEALDLSTIYEACETPRRSRACGVPPCDDDEAAGVGVLLRGDVVASD